MIIHISDNDLVVIREGGTLDPRLAEHVRTCPDCQERLRGMERTGRWVAAALQNAPIELHPPADLLATYLDREASSRERELIDAHLEACDECRESLFAAREAVSAWVAEPVPPPARQVDRAMAEWARRAGLEPAAAEWSRFRGQPVREWTVIETLGDVARALAPIARVLVEGAASLRIRLENAWDAGPEMETLSSPSCGAMAPLDAALLAESPASFPVWRPSAMGPPRDVGPAAIRIGDLAILVSVKGPGSAPILALELHRVAPDTPPVRAEMEVRGADGSIRLVRTDEDGRLDLPLDTGERSFRLPGLVEAWIVIDATIPPNPA